MDRDSDTMRGISRVFGVDGNQLRVLTNQGIVLDHHFDDGTLHIDFDIDATLRVLRNTMSNDAVDLIIDSNQRVIDMHQRTIDALNLAR